MERVYKVWHNAELVLISVFLVSVVVAITLYLLGVNLSNVPKDKDIVGALLVIMYLYVISVALRMLTLGSVLENRYALPVGGLNVLVGELLVNSVLYKQGLRSGDVVLRANAKSLTNATFPLQTWWQNQDSIMLTVLRNAQEVEVTLRKE